MMSKQLQRSDRDQDDYQVQKLQNQENRFQRDDESDSSSDVRVPNSMSRDTASSTLSILCNNQAEEIRQLYDQLSRRELDLKEMRYNYINAVKGSQSNNDSGKKGQSNNAVDSDQNRGSELIGSLHLTSSGTKGSRILDPQFYNLNQEITRDEYDNNDNNDEEDDNNDDNDNDEDDDNNTESSSQGQGQNQPAFRQSYPTVSDLKYSNRPQPEYVNRTERRNMTSSRETDRTVNLRNEKNEKFRNTSTDKTQKNKYKNLNIQKTEMKSEGREVRRKNNENENENEELKNDKNSMIFQLFELKEFRDKVSTEYSTLQKSFDAMKLENEEKNCQLRESAGRLIRFVTGTSALSCVYIYMCMHVCMHV